MSITTILLAFVLVLLGFFAGILIGKMVKEEIEYGRRYFVIMEKVLLGGIALIGIYYGVYALVWWLIVIAVLLANVELLANVGFYSAFRERAPFAYTALIYALFFLIIFGAGAAVGEVGGPSALSALTVVGSMMFLYGLPAGTLACGDSLKMG